ncbi:MAG: cupin domain-containing protein [Alphaproteobacteria bacterium]
MAELVPTRAEIEEKYVARYENVVPSAAFFLDTALPEYERQVKNVIGAAAGEDPSTSPAIAAPAGVNFNYIVTDPGKGSALHDHPVWEIFVPVDGRWSIFWGTEDRQEVELGPLDVIAVPPGVMRGFSNIGDKTSILIAMLGADDVGQVTWAQSLLDATKGKGIQLDENGQLVTDGAGD